MHGGTYSIDESFLIFSGNPVNNLLETDLSVRIKILK